MQLWAPVSVFLSKRVEQGEQMLSVHFLQRVHSLINETHHCRGEVLVIQQRQKLSNDVEGRQVAALNSWDVVSSVTPLSLHKLCLKHGGEGRSY